LLYDVLNNIIIDSIITHSKTHEIKIVTNTHLSQVKKDDLIIFDRGYPSYELFTRIIYKTQANFVVRMKRGIYKKYTDMLFDKNSKITDTVVTLTPSTKEVNKICKEHNLPKSIKVRFVQVILDNGDIEVLATSVLDKTVISTQEFKELYFNRWKIETYYDIMKNRLSLENFSGTTALSVKQDFYVTMFISNLESALSHGLNEELENEKENKKRKYTQKVNKSVSFNTIKNYAFDLFFLPDKDIAKTLDKIYKQLRTNLIAIRPNRHYSRPDNKESKNTRAIKSATFYKRKKKSRF
jgi:hypothetical protein